jgi:hypothetical protein
MARLHGTIHTTFHRLQPMIDSMASLADALAAIEFCGAPPDFELEGGRLLADGAEIATFKVGSAIVDDSGLVFHAFATPTIQLSLFVAALVARIPALRVEWLDCWPQFSASPRDNGKARVPAPDLPAPELLPC